MYKINYLKHNIDGEKNDRKDNEQRFNYFR